MSLMEKLLEIAHVWFNEVKDDVDDKGNKLWVDKDGDSAFTVYYNSEFFFEILEMYDDRDWDPDRELEEIDSFDAFVDWELARCME